jgi:EmrB/QacA subfamily drug resistance transporter
VAPGLGPTIGGYFVEYVNWRLIFFINVPVGILGAIAAIVVLPHFPTAPAKRFDLLGFLCVAAGLFCLLLAVSEGTDWGWTSYPVLILMAAGVNLLALFAVVELHAPQPLLDVRALASLPFLNSMMLVSILFVGLFAGFFYIPVFLQQGQNITAMNTGLTILPQAAALVIMTPIAGRLYDRIGARWPAVIGLALDGIGTLLIVNINADMTRTELSWWMVIRAAGVGLAMMPIITSGIASLPASLAGPGSTFTTLFQRVAAALGLAALTGLATSQQAQYWADRTALVPAYGPTEDPRLIAMSHKSPSGLVPLWQQLHLQVEAQAYSNIFLVVGVATLVATGCGLFLRHGRPVGGAKAEPVEM